MKSENNYMENRKLDDKKRYLYAFLIGTSAFILIFLISYGVSYYEYQKTSIQTISASYDIFKDKYLLEKSELLCQNETVQKLSQDLYYQGKIITDLEDKFGKNDERVLFQKKFYTLVLLEHLDFIKNLNKNCNYTFKTILFFYSNAQENLDKSEYVGSLLDYIVTQDSNIKIYSFDVDLDDILIKSLTNKYKITKTPTLVLNEKTILISPQSVDQIKESFNK